MESGGRDWVTSRQLGSWFGCCTHTSAHIFLVSVSGDIGNMFIEKPLISHIYMVENENDFLFLYLIIFLSLMSEGFWLLNATSPMWPPH